MACGINRRIAAILGMIGKTITFRRITSIGTVTPSRNPVNGNVSIATPGFSAGVSLVTLTAPAGNWALLAGDKFTIAGDVTVYIVQVQKVAASGKFTDVSISPALTANAVTGAAVTFTWAADYSVKADIGRYEPHLIDGTTITARDLRVTMPTVAKDGRTIPAPTPVDQLIIDGVPKTIGMVAPFYLGENVTHYEIQAKG